MKELFLKIYEIISELSNVIGRREFNANILYSAYKKDGNYYLKLYIHSLVKR